MHNFHVPRCDRHSAFQFAGQCGQMERTTGQLDAQASTKVASVVLLLLFILGTLKFHMQHNPAVFIGVL